MSAHNILIIGGTGVFGKRLVRHLSRQPGLVLHVSSRSVSKVATFINTISNAQAELRPIALDTKVNLQHVLDQTRPDIVVDCSGPFQGASYATAQAALEAGAHFIDLADARDYLAGFSDALDETARQNGVRALSGASSTPTLSTCVAQHLTQGWQRVDTIDIAITPGGKSEVGRSVIEAILSYVGKEVPVWTNGRLSQTTGWRNAKRIDIAGLGRRRVAAVETFDAEYLGPLLNVQSRVSFSAGLESIIEQRGIEMLAGLRKRGLIGAPHALIPLLLKARRLTRIPTSASGGMQVEISGLNEDGIMTHAKWSLVARQDHGPYVPILPAAAAIRKLLSGLAGNGADFAHSILTVADIVAEMQPYDISTETSEVKTDHSVFEQAIGKQDFERLPTRLQHFHGPTGPIRWTGQADITRGHGALSRLVARVFGFPQAGAAVPVTVSIDRRQSAKGAPMEVWTRTFARKSMTSVLSTLGKGLICERFAPFTFALRLDHDAQGIRMPVASWRIGKLPLPKVLAPRSETREFVDSEGRFRFDVRLAAPWVGSLVHYRGWLEPDSEG